ILTVTSDWPAGQSAKAVLPSKRTAGGSMGVRMDGHLRSRVVLAVDSQQMYEHRPRTQPNSILTLGFLIRSPAKRHADPDLDDPVSLYGSAICCSTHSHESTLHAPALDPWPGTRHTRASGPGYLVQCQWR